MDVGQGAAQDMNEIVIGLYMGRFTSGGKHMGPVGVSTHRWSMCHVRDVQT